MLQKGQNVNYTNRMSNFLLEAPEMFRHIQCELYLRTSVYLEIVIVKN